MCKHLTFAINTRKLFSLRSSSVLRMTMSGPRLSFLLMILFSRGWETQTNDALSPELSKQLSNLLRPLREISVRLRTREDASNRFVTHFFQQSVCPVKIYLKTNVELRQNRNNVILTNTSGLRGLTDMYSSRLGTQFFILDGAFDPSTVTAVSRAIWNRWGIYKNYYVTNENEVFFYNPFAIAKAGVYGKLEEATNGGDFVRILKNLNGYPIKTYIFRSVFANLVYNKKTNEIKRAEGADAKVAYTIAKKINCTLILQEPDDAFFGHRLENGSFDGAIGRSIRYETELTLTGFFVKDYLTRDVEFSVTVYMDKLCCYVSKAKRIPQSILPLFSVKKDMWLGFIGTAFLWAFIWCIIRRLNQCIPRDECKTTSSYQYLRILIDTWVVWVRVNISRYPPFTSEKFFVISLCLVSVIFGAIFESSLATVYINPLYYKDINTLQELDDTRFKILIKHAAMKDDLFYGSNSPIFKRLDSKLLYVTEMEDRVIEMMSKRGGVASVTRASSLILDDINYILSKKIHQIPECPKTYHIAYILPKESPYRQKVDDLLLRFVSAGLIDYWIDMMYYQARIGVLKSPEILKFMGSESWKVLTINDLQLAFYVVILGSILASGVLMVEICFAYRRKWGAKFRSSSLSFEASQLQAVAS